MWSISPKVIAQLGMMEIISWLKQLSYIQWLVELSLGQMLCSHEYYFHLFFVFFLADTTCVHFIINDPSRSCVTTLPQIRLTVYDN